MGSAPMIVDYEDTDSHCSADGRITYSAMCGSVQNVFRAPVKSEG